ncbi:shugoshin 1 [Parambassis ranga]|uniref:Shugoshin 1 n=1 Tax=Parambassis ranga TaxID=210632 RepID=A0A6P7HSN6_9TELE|nr:shugoshin 1 [Parambassis ranga]
MAKERAQKKTFKESLEDIKERMKEKRNKRLARASAPSRGRGKMINKSSGTNSSHTILNGLQLNNKSLALAVQAEKEKVKHANSVILHLKKEQQALFLHLLLLKKKLKEQEVLVANASQTKPTGIVVEPHHHVDSSRGKRVSQKLDEHVLCEASPVSEDSQQSKKNVELQCDKQINLPPTVGVRRRHADRTRSRSEHVQGQSEGDAGCGALPSPIHSNNRDPKQMQQGAEPEMAEPIDTEELQHSTPEPVPTKKSQQQPSKKKDKQQHSAKPEPPSRKPERGRKPERAPLKKPWENSKPRARSKSRDRSATRAKTAPSAQSNKLNTSLGFNDTFDFDNEEVVHVTPFRAKAENNQPASPINKASLQKEQAQTEAVAEDSKHENSCSSLPSSESEDSLYVPQKPKRRLTSPKETKVTITRRGRPSKVIGEKENIPPKQKISVFKDEESESEKAVQNPHSPCSSFSNSPNPAVLENGDLQMEMDPLLPVSPLVETEMMRIDNVVSNFGNASCETSPILLHKTPQMLKSKKRGLGVRRAGRGLSLCDVTNLSPAAFRKFSSGGSRPSDARCSTPVPARKRRCTMVVDYKEPSLNAKLRRGDKHTDLQFLRSPIFKQKSGRRSVKQSRNSMRGQQPFEKYNESFVGCR